MNWVDRLISGFLAFLVVAGSVAFTLRVREVMSDTPKAEACRAGGNVWLSTQRACVKRVDN